MSHPVTSKLAAFESNKLRVEDQSAHNWYRFVLSFPPHLKITVIARWNKMRLGKVHNFSL